MTEGQSKGSESDMTDKVGHVARIRRLRYLVTSRTITLKQAIAWYFGL